MAHDHHDFICRECGALITCLSCLEIAAAQLPRGPAFIVENTKRVTPPVLEITDLRQPPPMPGVQQSLFI